LEVDFLSRYPINTVEVTNTCRSVPTSLGPSLKGQTGGTLPLIKPGRTRPNPTERRWRAVGSQSGGEFRGTIQETPRTRCLRTGEHHRQSPPRPGPRRAPRAAQVDGVALTFRPPPAPVTGIAGSRSRPPGSQSGAIRPASRIVPGCSAGAAAIRYSPASTRQVAYRKGSWVSPLILTSRMVTV